jgi:putative DNA primase/helicase
LAVASNSKILCLDELGQISGAEAGDAAYTLANGQAKARANSFGDARPRSRWRTILLSSGESSLADAVAEAGRSARAGQQVRILDVRADGRRHGAFDTLHGRKNGAAFSNDLVSAVSQHFGVAGPSLVSHIVAAREETREAALAHIEHFRSLCLEGDAVVDGQVERAVRRLGLIYAAGVIATLHGITGWNSSEALKAAKLAFDLWIAGRGGKEAAESLMAVTATRNFLSRFGQSRFDHPGQLTSAHNRAGWRKGDRYYITRDVFSEIHAGNDPQQAARYLKQRGFLLTDKGSKHLTRKAPNGLRCFCVSAKIMDVGD